MIRLSLRNSAHIQRKGKRLNVLNKKWDTGDEYINVYVITKRNNQEKTEFREEKKF